MLLDQRFNMDFDENQYSLVKTVRLDEYYDTVNEITLNRHNSFMEKSGSGKMIAAIYEEEMYRNPWLIEYQKAKANGDTITAKKYLNLYLDENPRARLAKF